MELSDLKPGDKVIYAYGPPYQRKQAVRAIVRVTTTQIIINAHKNTNGQNFEQRFNRTTGRALGESGYAVSRIETATDEELRRVRDNNERDRLVNKLSNKTTWVPQTLATLRAVEALLIIKNEAPIESPPQNEA